ncbi:hypothetical protein HMPREF1043_2223 [Streptococcus anginosus subsp. whileyi CCUG 39159]|uniref:Uncharacterized protein n=1 Tax=Streptococcus anginosus subsp. whileyi CCUG 39159 TaxID=1095729 RepID=I0S7N3_STRAP|nr:hypothetical protein HMPREF1043_2223 [Streptococcus anginosus subsp. whileyi CCUG 39159]
MQKIPFLKFLNARGKEKINFKTPPRTLARAREPRQDIILRRTPIFQIFKGCHGGRIRR